MPKDERERHTHVHISKGDIERSAFGPFEECGEGCGRKWEIPKDVEKEFDFKLRELNVLAQRRNIPFIAVAQYGAGEDPDGPKTSYCRINIRCLASVNGAARCVSPHILEVIRVLQEMQDGSPLERLMDEVIKKSREGGG